MRASKTRVASKGSRVAIDEGRSASSLADTQQQSARGMSSELQGALATVASSDSGSADGSSLRRVADRDTGRDLSGHERCCRPSHGCDEPSPAKLRCCSASELQAERGQAAPVATVDVAACEHASVQPSCLITKWGAIWLMQISNSERRPRSIDRRLRVEGANRADEHLDRFPRPTAGSARTPSTGSQSAACAARARVQQDLPRRVAQPAAVLSQEDSEEFASLHEPANGWAWGRTQSGWSARAAL